MTTTVIMGLVLGTIASILLFMLFIPYLHRLKFGQAIRTEGPKEHLKKQGTPTMGGIVIIMATIITFWLFMWLSHAYDSSQSVTVFLLFLPLLGYGLLGFVDDYLIVVKKNNRGIRPRAKFILMLIISGIYYYCYLSYRMPSTINIFGWVVDLGFLYGVFVLVFFASATNAVNLTDGLDGLAGGLIVIALIAFAGLAFYQENYLTLYFIIALIAAILGFMIFNVNPASIFMGNTGSLALGGALAGIAIMLKVEMLLLVIGIVFVCETLSVIIQIYYFKLTKGKRFFKMAPIHHHFELCGYSEWQIDLMFWSTGIIFGLIGLVLGVRLF
jgi:phospho-N-acetylmuramoyl-pentapeptide-transferase